MIMGWLAAGKTFLGVTIKKGMASFVKYPRTFQSRPKLSRFSSWYSPTSSKVRLCLYFPISKGRKCCPGRVLSLRAGSLWHTDWLTQMLPRDRLTSHPGFPLVFAFAPKAKQERERKNGALVFCCTDISMLHSYLNIGQNLGFLRKQNVKTQLILYPHLRRKGLSSPSSEQTSQGTGQEVWGRETAGRGEKRDCDEVILNLKILYKHHIKWGCQAYKLWSQKKIELKEKGTQNEI